MKPTTTIRHSLTALLAALISTSFVGCASSNTRTEDQAAMAKINRAQARHEARVAPDRGPTANSVNP